MKKNYQALLNKIYHEIQPIVGQGQVADYIPVLAQVNPNKFGMAITTVDGEEFSVGNANEHFSIQSISKVFTLTMAMEMMGDQLWKRVYREPSGNRFNSLVQLEHENGIPRNPFINAGALIITDAITTTKGQTLGRMLQFVRELAANKEINYNLEVAHSEKEHGHRNAAMAHFLKSFDNLEHLAEDVLDVYFTQCSLEMSCIDLARAFLFLGGHGKSIFVDRPIIPARQAKRINALMLTCGLYDAVGDFAYRVGLPGKSGVGGGIVAVLPGELVVSVWSPALDACGNSLAGIKALELFTTYAENSIF